MYDKSIATILDYHRSMINDSVRMDAFRRAIEQTVRPGDKVLDIGCGSGILSFLACQAGARRVIAVDSGEVSELARQLSRQLGFADRIDCRRLRSQDLQLSERADVLITETLGNGGFDEGILGTVLDARRRLLHPEARILPGGLALHLCALDDPDVTSQLEAWPENLHGLDFSSVRSIAGNQLAWGRLRQETILSAPAALPYVDLAHHEDETYQGRCELTIDRSGTLRALGGWFHSLLTPDIRLSNEPQGGAPNWQQVILPILDPLPVAQGDRLQVRLDVQADGGLWSWRAEHLPKDGGAAQHRQQSTFLGTLQSGDALRRSSPDFRPELADDGHIELFVLRQMDGHKSMTTIAQHVAERFERRFASVDQALDAVRSICRRLAR